MFRVVVRVDEDGGLEGVLVPIVGRVNYNRF